MAAVVGIIFVVALFGLVFGILFLKDRMFGRRAQPSAGGTREHVDKLGAKLRKYVGRSAPWSRLNESQLFVHDLKSQPPRLLTMEPLHQLLFESADGEHTVGELLDRLVTIARKNGDKAADKLAQAAADAIAELEQQGVIRLTDAALPLQPEFAYATQPRTTRVN